MAARQLFRRSAAPVAAGLISAGVFAYPRPVFAESPESEAITFTRKPIYDDLHAIPPKSEQSSEQTSDTTPDPPDAPPTDTTVTPTERLAAQIRRARLALYQQSATAETHVNDMLTRALRLESSFTDTVASLAPPPTANEPLVPGFTYVLVSALAGSILTRNRGILLRFSVPLAFGFVAAEAALPVTVRNVGDLAWRWEEKYPELARRHIEVRERLEQFWETGKSHLAMTKGMIEEKTDEAKKGVEDWVSKGK